ncbi:MAG: ABC transporter ATP-binding protein [Opitutales bacterium]|nr:ABC transporter ATP-binding protein [Opitutales bacterium]
MGEIQQALVCKDLLCCLGEGASRIVAVDHVNLSISPGEVVSISGPSGCGKSSLLYALGLLDQVSGGEIEIAGKPVPAEDSERTRLRNEAIGFVFQFHYLLPEFTALENVLIPMRKLGARQASSDYARELLAAVDMSDLAHRPAHQLSGGERQRVALARALANHPSILLADEPTGNLDQENSDRVFQLLKRLSSEKQMGVLMVTHNASLAEQADRCLSMLDGRIVNY